MVLVHIARKGGTRCGTRDYGGNTCVSYNKERGPSESWDSLYSTFNTTVRREEIMIGYQLFIMQISFINGLKCDVK